MVKHKTKRERLELSVTPATRRHLEEIAERDECDMSSVVSRLVRIHFENWQAKQLRQQRQHEIYRILES